MRSMEGVQIGGQKLRRFDKIRHDPPFRRERPGVQFFGSRDHDHDMMTHSFWRRCLHSPMC